MQFCRFSNKRALRDALFLIKHHSFSPRDIRSLRHIYSFFLSSSSIHPPQAYNVYEPSRMLYLITKYSVGTICKTGGANISRVLFQAVSTHVKSLIRVDLGPLDTVTAPPKPTGTKVVIHSAVDADSTITKLEDAFSKLYHIVVCNTGQKDSISWSLN